MAPIIAVAGATGDLGGRIAKALESRGAVVRKLTRADLRDARVATEACRNASCVVSALNGLHDTVIGVQTILLLSAAAAGVPRFISSDYSLDFTHTVPGGNRNLDWRRDFMSIADREPGIKVTSILNGAFMDMLGREMPLIQPKIKRVIYWGSADQKLDFTTKDNVASFVAAAALDSSTPRILRCAGEVLSARELADVVSSVSGNRYGLLWAGPVASLNVLIRIAKTVAPQENEIFPPWQGMQYTRDMFSGLGKLRPLDNGRYADLKWTSVYEMMKVRGDKAIL